MMTSQGFRIYLGINYHIWTRIITNLGSLRIGAVKEISELHLETLSSVNSMDSKPTAFDSIFPVFHHFPSFFTSTIDSFVFDSFDRVSSTSLSLPTHFRHFDEGYESLTLHDLWSHCRSLAVTTEICQAAAMFVL